MTTEQPTCDECGTARTEDDGDYNPLQVVLGLPVGWYSGRDGEVCGPCMTELFNLANGRKA